MIYIVHAVYYDNYNQDIRRIIMGLSTVEIQLPKDRNCYILTMDYMKPTNLNNSHLATCAQTTKTLVANRTQVFIK